MRLRSIMMGVCAYGMTSSLAWAQLEEVIVTGDRISGDSYSDIPAVTVEKRADFLVQRIRLINDTRAEEGRHKELYQTIRDLLADAARRPGMALGYGDDFLIPITDQDYEIPLEAVDRRPDTNQTELYVKLALGPTDDVATALKSLQEFIKKARVSGRTEILPLDDVGLSIVKPERYRLEIIEQIIKDAKALQGTLGARCQVSIAGLSNRVSWQRSDVSQLTLYIPYEVELENCQ